VFGLSDEHPQLSWTTFTDNFDRLTQANPGNRPSVLAKSAPGVYWNSVPLAQMADWIKAHVDAGMTQTLADNLATARFKLDQKSRLVQAADKVTGQGS
jgi:hypothetical protein